MSRYLEYTKKLIAYERMLQHVDIYTTSPGGWEFLHNAKPKGPVQVLRLEDSFTTRVWWPDGEVEDVDDTELSEFSRA